MQTEIETEDYQTTKIKKDNLIYDLRGVYKNREAEGVAFQLTIPTLQISRGEKIALIGQSGCGKSVLLKHIINLMQPDKGYILVEGIPIKKVRQKELFCRADLKP